jgi:hypothetical protein
MTTHVLQFVELSDQDRKTARPLGKLGKGDQVEVRVRRKSGKDHCRRYHHSHLEPAPLPCEGAEEVRLAT